MTDEEIKAMMALSDNDFLAWLPDPMMCSAADSIAISAEIDRRFPGVRDQFNRKMVERMDEIVKGMFVTRAYHDDLPSLFADPAPDQPPPLPDRPPLPPLRPAMASDDLKGGNV